MAEPTRRRRKPVAKIEPALFTGDSISQSISMQVPLDGMETWIRQEATTTVQEGEDYRSASVRLRHVVEETMDASIQSLLDN